MPDNFGENQFPMPGQGAGNLPNPRNTDRAILERIEHKLDTIFAMLQARGVTVALPDDKESTVK